MIILVYIYIYIYLNEFAYGNFINLDIIAKIRKFKLKKLTKFKFLFARNKSIKELKDHVGSLSYKLQILHLVVTIPLFITVAINEFLNIETIYTICHIILFIYFSYTIILAIRAYKCSKECREILLYTVILKEKDKQYAEIERQKVIDKFTYKDK